MFITGFAYQCRSGLEITKVTTALMKSQQRLSTVRDLPIGSIGWSLGPHNLGGLQLRCIIFLLDTFIGLSQLCCHSILYFLNNHSVVFLTQLHFISEYCRILNIPHHLRLYWNCLNTLLSSSSREGENWEAGAS